MGCWAQTIAPSWVSDFLFLLSDSRYPHGHIYGCKASWSSIGFTLDIMNIRPTNKLLIAAWDDSHYCAWYCIHGFQGFHTPMFR